jgi:hypothetical protein
MRWMRATSRIAATFALLGLLLLPSPCVAQTQSPAQHKWERYTNVRFAFSICYPSDLLIGQGEPTNSDGQKFLSRDGRAYAAVAGIYDVLGQSFKDEYLSDIKDAQDERFKITYRVFKQDWFVISGAGNGKIYYQKSVLFEGIIKSLWLEYPEDARADFDKITEKMSACFHTNLPRPF